MSDIVWFFGWAGQDTDIFVIQNARGTEQSYTGDFYETFGSECLIEYNQHENTVKIKPTGVLPDQLMESAFHVCPNNWFFYGYCHSICQI